VSVRACGPRKAMKIGMKFKIGNGQSGEIEQGVEK
jgi:hypothetical protein